MKMNHLLFGLAFGLVGLTASAQTQNTGSFSSDQVKQIQNVIHDYLVKNPQVLVEVSQALQSKQMKEMQSNTTKAIAKFKNAIFSDSTSPYAGNKDGNVVLVEFFDYQCGHCKDMKSVVEGLIKKNPNLKVIFKEFPIFGANSELASKMALAANLQGKYFQFHEALLAAGNPLTPDKITKIAQSLNLNMADIQKNISTSTIVQELKNNLELAKGLKIMGTPAFIIGNKDMTHFGYVPGAASQDELQAQIDAVAKGQNGPANAAEGE